MTRSEDTRTFVKVHDGYPDHPKVAAVGGDAAWLNLCAWCYSSRHLTDGRIPKAVVPRLSDRRSPARLARLLVEHGMWIDDGDSYVIHDYLQHQRSAQEVEELREKRRKAGSKGGKAKANRLASATAIGKQDASKPLPETETDTEPKNQPPSPSARPPQAKRLPDDWRPHPEPDLVEAIGGQQAAAREYERFCDYWRAKGGQAGRKLDWQATWRNWLRRTADDRPGNVRPIRQPQASAGDIAAGYERLAEHLEAEGR